MDFGWGDLISAGSSLLGSIFSNDAADNRQDQANQISGDAAALVKERNAKVDAMVQKLTSLTPPNLQSYIQPYIKQVVAGTITPEMAISQLQGDTKLAGIQVPQSLLDAQKSALTQMQNIATQGGMTAMDRAQLNDIQAKQANRSAAEQGAIIDNAQQRGVSGSGLEMAARLVSQQGAANQASADGTQVAANAQQRALQAIRDSGTMASQQRDQEVAQQTNAARAQDTINNFNTNLTNQTNASNTAVKNAAQVANITAAQQVANNNAEIARAEQAAKLAAAQQGWTNSLNQATTAATTTAGLANNALGNQQVADKTAVGLNNQADAGNAAAIQQLGAAGTSLVNAFKEKKETT